MLHEMMRNKRGGESEEPPTMLRNVIIFVILLLLFIAGVWFLSNKQNSVFRSVENCSSQVPRGICLSQDECKSHSKIFITTKDCEGAVCCLVGDDNIEPGSYGSSDTANFEIKSISISNTAVLLKDNLCKCVNIDGNPTSCPDVNQIIQCTPDKTVNIEVTVTVTNGPKELNIYANPWIWNSWNGGTQASFQGSAKKVAANQPGVLTATYQITKTSTFPSGEGNEHKIYAAAKTSKNPIIYVSDAEQFVTIRFKS
jgi:hypothetical protein